MCCATTKRLNNENSEQETHNSQKNTTYFLISALLKVHIHNENSSFWKEFEEINKAVQLWGQTVFF